jgi:hypothetical protein
MNTNNETNTEKFESWAVVELFGHQKIAGKVSEATIAGGAFIRVDVPQNAEQKAFTKFLGTGAIYSINPTTEEIATAMASYIRATPVHYYELPKLAERSEAPHENEEPEEPEEPEEDVAF